MEQGCFLPLNPPNNPHSLLTYLYFFLLIHVFPDADPGGTPCPGRCPRGEGCTCLNASCTPRPTRGHRCPSKGGWWPSWVLSGGCGDRGWGPGQCSAQQHPGGGGPGQAGGCHLAAPPPHKAAVGLGAGCSPWPRGLPGVSAFPYLSQKSRRCELCEPWAGTSCAALGGGAGEKPLSVGNGLPKDVPPPPVPPAGCGSGRGTLGCRPGPRMGVIWGDFHNLQDFMFVFF